jgi:genome maintenance exonuclease 1
MDTRRTFEHIKVHFDYDDLLSEDTENGRVYVTEDNTQYPSITTVLSILSRDSIAAWRKRVGDAEANRISKEATTRGSAVHQMVEDYIDNKEDYKGDYLPYIIDNFEQIRGIIDKRIGKVYAQEQPLYSNHLGVAGRVDCVAEFDGKLSIIDFKTSKKRKERKYCENYFMQESAYAIMWEERTGKPITQLVTIMSVDNDHPLVFVEHRDDWTEKLHETIKAFKDEQRTLKG